ncbi:MAG: SHOCT domain-containing protein [Burkholderiaceae bacterium]
MFHDGGYMIGMHGLWWMFWLVIVVAFLFIGRGHFGSRGDRPRESPLDVLQRRLASGDLSPAEYEQRKVLLDRDGGRAL